MSLRVASRAPVRSHGGLTALLLVLAGAGGGCSKVIGGSATGGADGGTGGATGTGGTSGQFCNVQLAPVAPASLTGLAVGAVTTVRVRGTVTGTLVSATATWTWSATFADGASLDVRQVQPSAPELVEIPIARAGSYTIAATLAGNANPCSGSLRFVVAQPGARTAYYVLRLTPPPAGSPALPSALPAQQTDPIAVAGGTPLGDNVFMLNAGISVAVAPTMSAGGAKLGAYVRATETTSGLFQEAHATGGGAAVPAQLALPPGKYDLLVVPDGDVAPTLLPAQRPVDLATTPVVLDTGVAVAGQVLDATGAPLAGAKISLRSGGLPSTVGTTDATGAFTLRARAGSWSATIAPAGGRGAWQLSVPAASAFALAGAAASMSVRLASLPTARIALSMTGAGPSAKVLVESRDDVASAAAFQIVSAGATIARTASARIRAEMTVGPSGAATTDPLPRGHYRVTVLAAGAAPSAATMTTVDDVDATAGDVARAITMAAPVMVSGTLTPGPDTARARVSIIDDAVPVAFAPAVVAPFLGEVDLTGAFRVAVNPSRIYRTVVDPPPGGAFARTVLPALSVLSMPVVVSTQALPRALIFAGRVVDPGLGPVRGVLVSAYCTGTGADCVDPTHPAAEATTAPDGTFLLDLPDPGITTP